jgi:hypothetical protein
MSPGAILIGRPFIFGTERSHLEHRIRVDHRQKNLVFLPLNPRAERDGAEAKLCIGPCISCARGNLQRVVGNLNANDLIDGLFVGDIGHGIVPFMLWLSEARSERV